MKRSAGRTLAAALGAAAVAAGGALGAMGLAGCAGWQSWPPNEGEAALSSPNSAVALDVMEASLRWALEKRPPKGHDGPVALNLPTGVTELAYQGVARDVGHGSVPLSTRTAHLPIYHLVSYRLRVDEAHVELLRPALPADTYTDEMRIDPLAYEGYMLTLKGTLTGWKVEWYQERTAGVIGVPQLNFIDVPDIELPEPEAPEPEAEPVTDETPHDSPPDSGEAARRARETATGG